MEEYKQWMSYACHETEGEHSAKACYIMGVEMLSAKKQYFAFNYFKKACDKGAEKACRFAKDEGSLDPLN